MPFDAKAFAQAKLAPRTRAVPVPDLAGWFEEGEEPVWVVRSLSANEIAKIREAETRNKREAALLEAITQGSKSEIVRELQATLGRGPDTRPDLARRLETLALGSLEPACSEELAVRLGQHFPVTLYQLTDAIMELSGRGSDVEKKPESSGETQKSAPH